MSEPAVQTRTEAAPAPEASSGAVEDTLFDPLATVDASGSATSPAATDDPRTDKGTELGKQSWEAALGATLGGKLYAAIAPQLTDAKLADYATTAWGASVTALADLVKANPQAGEGDLSAKISESMKKELPKLAEDMLKANGGKLGLDIGGFVDGNPYLVVLAALAGAAAFVATNQPIPAIKQEIGLASGKIGFGLKLNGGALDIAKSITTAIGELQLSYAWTGGMVDAGYKRADDGSHDLTASANASGTDKYKDKEGNDVEFERYKVAAGGAAKVNKDGTMGDWSANAAGNIALGDKGQTNLGLSGKAANAAGVTSGSATATAGYTGEKGSLSGAATVGSDGAYDVNAKGDYSNDGLEVSGSAAATRAMVDGAPVDAANAQLAAKKDFGNGFVLDGSTAAAHTAAAGLTTTSKLAGAYTQGGLSAGGSAELQTGGAGGPLGLFGANAGYKSENGSISGNALVGTDGRYDLGLQGAYDAGNGLSVTGSAGMSRNKVDDAWQNAANAKLGLEYKKKNLSISGGLGVDVMGNKATPSANLSVGFSF